MSEPFDALALYDALPPEERAAVDQALRDNPALADAFQRWQSLRAQVRRELAQVLPDRALLVLYALSDAPLPGEPAPPGADALDADERARLDAVLDPLQAALVKHPGLVDAVRRIRADRAAFDQVWNAHTTLNGHATTVQPTERPRTALDRAAAPAMRPVRRRPIVWRMAALAAVVVFGAIATYVLQRDAGFTEIRTAEARTVSLPDGSTAELAAGTTVFVAEDAGIRHARVVAGDALFTIRHDEADPFTVETPNATVTVLGTTFGVEVGEASTEVVLVDGVVTLASRGADEAPVRLAPGQRSQVLALDAPSEPVAADVDAALDWTGSLFLRDEPMARVAERLSDAFGVPVEVDAVLGQQLISATRFARDDGLEAALAELALALDATVEPLPDGGFRLVPASRPAQP